MNQVALPFEIHDYTLLEEIGHGAFSTVYSGKKNTSPDLVAIKVIDIQLVEKDGDKERLQREIDVMALLKHENIIQLHDFFSDEFRFFLVLDYCPGGDLYSIISQSKHFRETQIAYVFQQIVSAVGYCHNRGVAHRDLKPQNVLVTTFPYVKISDFGLCGYISDDKRMKTFCGSPFFSAPECLKQVQYDGKKSDIWSLGVILFELATGEHPWNPTNTPVMIKQITTANYTIPKGINPALEDLIRSLLKVRPNERPSCEQILQHPWLKLAPGSRNFDKSQLPPLQQQKPINTVIKGIDRSGLKSEHGVFSPFLGLPEEPPEESPPKPRMPPAIVQRSRSGSQIKSVQGPGFMKMGRTTRTPTFTHRPANIPNGL